VDIARANPDIVITEKAIDMANCLLKIPRSVAGHTVPVEHIALFAALQHKA